MPIADGTLIDGRYRTLRFAGEGGMGSVYQATDEATNAHVAIKVLSGPLMTRAARFAGEVEVLAELSHPAIVRYVGAGTMKGGMPYLAMEWIDGESLDDRLERGPLELREALSLVLRAAEGLGAAHAMGIVHRDVKPSNLVLPRGVASEVKVVDFGLARARHLSRRPVTRTGVLLGTPGYMAPEQVRGSPEVDARADVFSLGCVLYEALATRPAFTGEQPVALLFKILLEAPSPPSVFRPEIPRSVDRLVRSMLEKDKEARPRDGKDVAARLRRILRSLEPAAIGAGRKAQRPSLTELEQRVVSVVMVTSDDLVVDESGATLPSGSDETLHAELLPVARAYEARLLVLGQAAVLAYDAAREPKDLAIAAVRLAAQIASSTISARHVVVATGHSVRSGNLPFGEVLERAVSLLRRNDGGVLVDELTAAFAAARFDLERRGDGRFVLLAESDDPVAPRTLLDRQSRFIGRERQVAIVSSLIETAVRESTPQVIVILGAPGIGKSRLLYEIGLMVAGGGMSGSREMAVWSARAEPFGPTRPSALLGAILKSACGIGRNDGPRARGAKLARCLDAAFGAGATTAREFLAPLVGATLSAPTGPDYRAAQRDEALLAAEVARNAYLAIERMTRVKPTLLLIDELAWADRASIGFLESLLDRMEQAPFVLMATARPGSGGSISSARLFERLGATTINLGRLSPGACARIAEDLFGGDRRPDEVARVAEAADGNPFCVEELVRAALDGDSSETPLAVLAMVETRLEQLSPESRRVVRAASLHGTRFTRAFIAALVAPDEESEVVDAGIAELVALEVITPEPDERDAYRFRHPILREAAYRTLTDEDRQLGQLSRE